MKIAAASDCRLDLLSLGECMVRLSPRGHGRIEFAAELETYAGGAEFNVSYAAARLGLRSGWISRLPDNPLGRLIRNHARSAGMDVSDVVWVPYDGVGRDDRVGLHFTEVGSGIRGSQTVYDRGHSAAGRMKPDDVDWKRVFSGGVRWFHTGGTFSALSPDCAKVAVEALRAAREGGAVTSYDLNFRSKLWTSAQAQAATREIMPHVRVLIGNEEDFTKVLGMKVDGTGTDFRGLKPASYRKMVDQVVKAYPTSRPWGRPSARSSRRPSTTGARSSGSRASSTRAAVTRTSRSRTASAAATASPRGSSPRC